MQKDLFVRHTLLTIFCKVISSIEVASYRFMFAMNLFKIYPRYESSSFHFAVTVVFIEVQWSVTSRNIPFSKGEYRAKHSQGNVTLRASFPVAEQ